MTTNSPSSFRIMSLLVIMVASGIFLLVKLDNVESPFKNTDQQAAHELTGTIPTNAPTTATSSATNITPPKIAPQQKVTPQKVTPQKVNTIEPKLEPKALEPNGQPNKEKPVINVTFYSGNEASAKPASYVPAALPFAESSVWEPVMPTGEKNVQSAWPKEQQFTEISIDAGQIKSLAAGSKVELPIPQLGRSYSANIAHKTTHENGDLSITGYIEGYQDEYPFIMTVGESKLFATIDTPEGSYMVESNAASTRIISVAELEQSMEYGQDDYVLKEDFDHLSMNQ